MLHSHSRSSSLLDKASRNHQASPAAAVVPTSLFPLCKYCLLFWSLWELHLITVSSPFPLLSNEVGSTPWSNKIWDTSDRCRLLGRYNRNLPGCGSCGKVGHSSNKCFAREKREARVHPVVTNAPESCFRCGEKGHLAGYCPKLRITQVEKKIRQCKSR